ncbi:hypothetical protein [Glaciecola sp. 1036]|uniref:hypothetical protein n=1 Tax=Alteromonadaceae TaxID=72275 RepID=UPI003D048D49
MFSDKVVIKQPAYLEIVIIFIMAVLFDVYLAADMTDWALVVFHLLTFAIVLRLATAYDVCELCLSLQTKQMKVRWQDVNAFKDAQIGAKSLVSPFAVLIWLECEEKRKPILLFRRKINERLFRSICRHIIWLSQVREK